MAWYLSAFELLSRWALQSTALLAVASLAVVCLRQPAKRLLLIEWSFVACLILPCLALLDIPREWCWRWPSMRTSAEVRQASGTRQRAGNTLAADPQHTPPPSRLSQPRTDVALSARAAGSPPRESGIAADTLAPLETRRLPSHDPRLWCVSAYLVGVGLMAGWWLIGIFGLIRVLRRSRPANARCRDVLQEVAGQAAAGVRLRESPLADQPFMFGWLRPTIILPDQLVSGDAAPLRWSLAHEWSHVSRGDAWWWSLAGIVRVALFYQPLVWWLRGQLRLSQDYLADAEAAGHAPAREDYAQFLTAWAGARRRHPVYGGLGILGRQSELYRRVAMLVLNQTSLDRRCSRAWGAVLLISLAAVVGTVATYTSAADKPEQAAKALRTTTDDAEHRDKQSAPNVDRPSSATNTAEQARLKVIIERVLKRATAIHSGQFCFNEIEKVAGIDRQSGAGTCVHISGNDFKVNQFGAHQRITVQRGDRVMVFDKPATKPVPAPELTIRMADSASAGIREALLPIRAGTVPTAAARRFVERHIAEARLGGETFVEDVAVTEVEWDVSAEEAAGVFAGTTELLEQGGLLRFYVAEHLGGVLPRVEYVDRFGSVDARFDASRFVETRPDLFFPEDYRVFQGGEKHYGFHDIGLVNEEISDDLLVIAPVPAGTRVVDERIRRGSVFDADGKIRSPAPGPLQNFMVGVAYEDGLPEQMLAAMDRAVLTAAELETLVQTPAPEAPPAGQELTNPMKPGKTEVKDEKERQPRYAGRSFADWRDQLLDDLDEETCVKAMEPIASFGRKGYAEEAVAALAKTLHDDRETVASNAANALVQVGSTAVPALIEGLADPRTHVRVSSAIALRGIGAEARPATKALLKLVDDPDKTVRWAAITGSMGVADDDALQPVLERILHNGDAADRHSLVSGLQAKRPQSGWMLKLLLRLSDDDEASVRSQAAQLLADCGPPEKEVISALKRLIRDLDQQVWLNAFGSLSHSQGNTETCAVVLVDALTSPDVYANLRQHTSMEEAFAILGRAREQAHLTVPVLIDFVDGKFERTGPVELHSAIQALGRLGPAAKAAIPALKRRISEGGTPAALSSGLYNEFTPRYALRALLKIQGSDQESQADKN